MLDFLKKIDLKTGVIIALVIIILLMRMCQSTPENKNKIIKIRGKKYEVLKIDTVVKTIKKTSYRRGEDIYHDTTIYINIPQDVDTNKILKNYFSLNVYIDTLKLPDSLGSITVTDTISQNKIVKRKYDTKINKVEINTYLRELPTNQLFLGPSLGLDKNNGLNNAGIQILLKTKNDRGYSLNVGVGPKKNVVLQGGILWKISLRKKD
jgi:hypothetical protein